MEPKGFHRKLTAILSADVAGYSRLMQDEEAASAETPEPLTDPGGICISKKAFDPIETKLLLGCGSSATAFLYTCWRSRQRRRFIYAQAHRSTQNQVGG